MATPIAGHTEAKPLRSPNMSDNTSTHEPRMPALPRAGCRIRTVTIVIDDKRLIGWISSLCYAR